jgi:transposase
MCQRARAQENQVVFHRSLFVKRCINWLRQWRGLATRYEKRAVNYRAMLVQASIAVWLES